jgi:putative alpha-1,2-mannosidase
VGRTRKLIGPVFNTEMGGLPGNDDAGIFAPIYLANPLGSLGAYLVWIMSGLVPIAGQSVYLILPPSFPEVQWTVTGSRIITHNFHPDHEFIQNVTVDGQPVFTNSIRLICSGLRIGSHMISFLKGRLWKLLWVKR